MTQARAAAVIFQDGVSDADKIAAIDVIADRGRPGRVGFAWRGEGARLAHSQALGRKRVGGDRAPPGHAELRAERLYGLSLGSVLLLAAIGLAITFGVMGIINMAHGEMVMLGAYTTFVVQEFIRTNYPGLFDWSLLIAIPLAFLVAGAVGVAIERGIIRFLYGRPLETLLATWGVSSSCSRPCGPFSAPTTARSAPPPTWRRVRFLRADASPMAGSWIVVFAMAVFAFLLFVLKATSLRAEDARRHPEPPHGVLHGHPNALGRLP